MNQLLRWETWSIVLLVVALTGCASSGGQSRGGASVPPTDEPARAAGMLEPEITAARELYIAKCVRCHKYYEPSQYDNAEWKMWMRKMSKKAHLKSEQEQLLSRYLGSFRAQSPK